MYNIISVILVSAGVSLIVGYFVIRWVKSYTKEQIETISNRFMDFLRKVKF